MSRYIPFSKEEKLDVVLVQNHPYLFTNMRIDRETIPEGLVAYDVADAEGDGTFTRIQKSVMVDYWGTLIGKDELYLDDDGKYFPEEDSDEYLGEFIGEYMNYEEYMDGTWLKENGYI